MPKKKLCGIKMGPKIFCGALVSLHIQDWSLLNCKSTMSFPELPLQRSCGGEKRNFTTIQFLFKILKFSSYTSLF